VRAGPSVELSPNRVTEAHDSAVVAHLADQRLAARVVASRATGVEDCSELLAMLGLSRAVGLPTTETPLRR
jgi:hypothetical protein